MNEQPKRLPKPSGWAWSRGREWYVKGSQFGQRYMCPYCGRKSLGIGGSHMHWPRCHLHPDAVSRDELMAPSEPTSPSR